MPRRKNKQIRKQILETLEKHGTMTANAVAIKINARHTTAYKHLEWLLRYTNKLETVFIKPKWKGYRLRT